MVEQQKDIHRKGSSQGKGGARHSFERRKAKHPEFTPGLTTAIHLQHILILFVIFLESEKSKDRAPLHAIDRSIVIAIFPPNLKKDRALLLHAIDRSIFIAIFPPNQTTCVSPRDAISSGLFPIQLRSRERIVSMILWPMTSSNDDKTRHTN
jgi:hypothetical protein